MNGSEAVAGIIRFDADPGAMALPIDKGLRGDMPPTPVAETGGLGLRLLAEDLPLPVAVLKASALANNSAWMRRFVEKHDVEIAPHGKTTMAPALFDLQRRDGAWGITVSSPHQIAAAIASGERRLFVANQIVGRAGIEYVLGELARDPALELYALADSVALVEQTEAIAAAMGAPRRMPLLVERGFANGRTGCRTTAEGLAVARAIDAAPHLHLAGIEGFEGIIRRSDLPATLAAVRDFLADVVELAEACDSEGLLPPVPLLSAGGSIYFDLVVAALTGARLSARPRILLRSGCYITHDSGLYTRAFAALGDRAPELFAHGAPQPALEVWAYVQSRPEPGRVIVTLGKRDASHDDMPVPLAWFRPGGAPGGPAPMPEGHRVVALNDQHGFLDVPEQSPLSVGDMVAFGISHPCLTFDKWRLLHVVDEDYRVLGSMRTYF